MSFPRLNFGNSSKLVWTKPWSSFGSCFKTVSLTHFPYRVGGVENNAMLNVYIEWNQKADLGAGCGSFACAEYVLLSPLTSSGKAVKSKPGAESQLTIIPDPEYRRFGCTLDMSAVLATFVPQRWASRMHCGHRKIDPSVYRGHAEVCLGSGHVSAKQFKGQWDKDAAEHVAGISPVM